MKRKGIIFWFLLGFLALMTTGCVITDLFSNLLAKFTGNGNEAILDDRVSRSENGGFQYQAPDDYENTEEFGIAQIIAPGGNSDTGPGFILIGGTLEESQTNEDLFEDIQGTMLEGDFSKPKKITVDGAEGLSISVDNFGEDEDIEGRVVIVMVTSTQEFLMIGMAPKGDWKTVSKDFDKVLKSIKFFEPSGDYSNDFSDEPSVEMTYEPMGDSENQPSAVTGGIGLDGYLHQWASGATASSEFTQESWSASQATGEPDVESCIDDGLAWASESWESVDWLEVTYDTPVIPYVITIVQSYNPSQVITVTGISPDGTEYNIWEGEPEIIDVCPYWMILDIVPEGDIHIDTIRITVDQSALGVGWNEIDAIELVGIP